MIHLELEKLTNLAEGFPIKRCAFIEDDEIFLKLVHDFFDKKSWLCDQFTNYTTLIEALEEQTYDLYIIDVNLPGLNGIEILKEIRNSQPQVPIVMVSGITDIEVIMDAYEFGCDEYLKKPFDLRELELKIGKLMGTKRLKISDSIFYDLMEHDLIIDGEIVDLSKKESNLLHIFMTNVNKPLTHEYLESSIWGKVEDNNGHALRNLVLRMRKRIGKGIIDTVQGKGYILRLNEKSVN